MSNNESTLEYNKGYRPPVVVILGHVDHGKTSILDYIRKSRVAEKETGGITQHVGAYQISFQDKLITFLDTPGHEAFSAMRARGANVADIALLVVAADDGVKPQTKEAIVHIKHAAIPYIVVLNKIDKPEANPMRVRGQLLEEGIALEKLGGQTPVAEVSAKNGQGIDGLLETILLLWEMEGVAGRLEGPAEGAVIESFRDPRRGATVTFLVREGILREQDIVATPSVCGKLRILEDFLGKHAEEAGPSMPVLALGLNEAPVVGEKFKVFASLEDAEAYVTRKARKRGVDATVITIAEGQKVLNLIIKADVQGSLEAIREVVRPLSNEDMVVRILEEGVGEVTDSDIKLAVSGNAPIVAFRVGIAASAQNFVRQTGVPVLSFRVIYELVQGMREAMTNAAGSEMIEIAVGGMQILAIFRTERERMIVGGRVTDGEARRGVRARVLRNGETLGEGRIVQVKIRDKEMERVGKGEDCGVLFEGGARIQENDTLELFTRERKKFVF